MYIKSKIIFFSLLAISFNASAESVWDTPKQVLAKPVDIVVYRSPTCGCCSKWITHLKKHNFNVSDMLQQDMQAVKKQLGVPAELASCHTAVVNGYWVEGHVPADDIKTLLTAKPDVHGLSVPAMPSGTPGMEMSGRKDAFNVIALDKQNQAQIYQSYGDY
jgi:hypothetical protein